MLLIQTIKCKSEWYHLLSIMKSASFHFSASLSRSTSLHLSLFPFSLSITTPPTYSEMRLHRKDSHTMQFHFTSLCEGSKMSKPCFSTSSQISERENYVNKWLTDPLVSVSLKIQRIQPCLHPEEEKDSSRKTKRSSTAHHPEQSVPTPHGSSLFLPIELGKVLKWIAAKMASFIYKDLTVVSPSLSRGWVKKIAEEIEFCMKLADLGTRLSKQANF